MDSARRFCSSELQESSIQPDLAAARSCWTISAALFHHAPGQDLEDFRDFAKASTLEQAAHSLLTSTLGQANAIVLDYKAHLLGHQLTPATINRRLAALRSLVKLARMLGLVPWKLEVEGMKSEGYRDTQGPGRTDFAICSTSWIGGMIPRQFVIGPSFVVYSIWV
jgi:hypothetical protein